ncbi:2067_t:CDS:2, partial [Scutellospora calospora]
TAVLKHYFAEVMKSLRALITVLSGYWNLRFNCCSAFEIIKFWLTH